MFESWYEVVWHIAYLVIFVAGIGLAQGKRPGKGYDVEEDDKRLDGRRRQGGHTFNTVLKQMRADVEVEEENTIEDLVSTDSAEVREIRAEQLRFLRSLKERIDRLLTMKEPD